MSTATKKITALEIRQLAQAEMRERLAFDESPKPRDVYDEATGDLIEQAPPDVPPASYFVALEEWIEAYDPDVLPEAYDAWKALKLAYDRYRTEGYANTPTWFMQSEEFYSACNKPQASVVLPSDMKHLIEVDKMSEIAAARTWKLYDSKGEPDTLAVQQELRNPGSVIDEKHKQWWIDEVRRLLRGDLPKDRKKPDRPQVKLPSIEDLLKQNASIHQVASVMARRYAAGSEVSDANESSWRGVVSDVARLMGLSPSQNAETQMEAVHQEASLAQRGEDTSGFNPVETAGHVSEQRVVTDPDKLEAELTEVGLPDAANNFEDQIAAMFNGGSPAEEIAAALELDQSEVEQVIAKLTSTL